MQVVQDFVQQTADEETPKEWLHRIMETNSREEGEHDINLLGNHIRTVHCYQYVGATDVLTQWSMLEVSHRHWANCVCD